MGHKTKSHLKSYLYHGLDLSFCFDIFDYDVRYLCQSVDHFITILTHKLVRKRAWDKLWGSAKLLARKN